ncbi:MAG: GAF domain-containing protein [Anaerolineales bacterium]|nr:GAF domain-containing protein [Anaerolineales bacterium]
MSSECGVVGMSKDAGDTRIVEKLNRLVDISLTLNSTLELDIVLENILNAGIECLKCEATSILLYNEEDEQLYFAAASGAESDELETIPVPLKGSIAGTIFTENHPLIVNNVPTDPRHYQIVEDRTGFHVRSLLGVPMSIGDRAVGVIEALNKHDGDFSDDDTQTLSIVASQAAVAINNARIVDELQKANEELRQADRLKADFMAVASHELRTPLGIILGYATFLKEEAEGELSELAKTVHGAAMRLRALLEDMTNMNLLYTGATELRLQPLRIQSIVSVAFDEISQMAEARDYQLDLIQPAQDIWVHADDRLQGVFANLLNNAVRFTVPDGEIIVRVSASEDDVFVEVKDRGIGIPPGELERIFEHFYQVEHHMTRRYEGLGLGLAIARGMVELHQGRIWAESDGPGKGSTFKVQLPRYYP